MKIDYTGKVVVVTGAGGSIGRASALLFASLGGSVVANDLDAQTLRETTDAIAATGGTAEAVVADITDPDAACGVVRTACERFGGIDVLFNNAGGSFPTPMESIDRKEHPMRAVYRGQKKNV